MHICFIIFKNMSNCSWLITWMNSANNCQMSKVQPQGVVSIFLFFRQYQTSVAYKKKRGIHTEFNKKWQEINTSLYFLKN